MIDLYLADGDVVLAVLKQTSKSDDLEEQPKYHVFRVHKSTLRHNSPVFANFFADASAAPTEVYDGVPLVEMQGDRTEDFVQLLRYLYYPRSLVFKRHDPNTPVIVSGVIRLADKYLMQPLYHRLVQQVRDDWPTTLDDYDIQQAELDMFRQVTSGHCSPKYTPEGGRLADAIPEPVSAILFAQEFGCAQILAELFTASPSSPSRTIGTTSRVGPTVLAPDGPSSTERICSGTLERGCQMLNEYRPEVLEFMCEDCAAQPGPEDLPGCEPVPCRQYIARLFEIVWNPGQRPSATHGDPLRLLTRCLKYEEMPELSKEHFPHGLCEVCYQSVFFGLLGERKRVWDNLSKWFMLE